MDKLQFLVLILCYTKVHSYYCYFYYPSNTITHFDKRKESNPLKKSQCQSSQRCLLRVSILKKPRFKAKGELRSDKAITFQFIWKTSPHS